MVVPLFVGRPARETVGNACNDGHDSESDADGVSRNELGRILAEESKDGDNTTDIAETNLPRTTDGTSVMASQVHVEPAHNDGHSRVGSHGDEEQTSVLHFCVVVHSDENGEAGNGDTNGENCKGRTVTHPVRDDGDAHGEAKSHNPGRHAVKLGLDRAVAIRSDYAGRKVGVSIGGNDEAKVHEAAENDLVVLEYVLDVGQSRLSLSTGGALVGMKTGGDVGPLLVVEPLDLLGEVGKQKVKGKADEDGEKTFENEDPAPAHVAANALHLPDGCGEKSSKGTG